MIPTTEEILKSIIKNKELVKYHDKWGDYIDVNLPSIHMIGLIAAEEGLELSLYFGETQNQARAFYSLQPNIGSLFNTEWELIPNFHFSNSFRNLIYFSSDINAEKYIEFWRENKDLLFQRDKEEAIELIDFLQKKKIILVDENTSKEINYKIVESDITRFNVCASLGVIYKLSSAELENLNKIGQLGKFLIARINEGLGIIGVNGNTFLNNHSVDIITSEGDPDGL